MLKDNRLEFVISRLKVILLGILILFVTSIVSLWVLGKGFEVFWFLFSWLNFHVSNAMLSWILILLLLAISLFLLLLTVMLFILGVRVFIRSILGNKK